MRYKAHKDDLSAVLHQHGRLARGAEVATQMGRRRTSAAASSCPMSRATQADDCEQLSATDAHQCSNGDGVSTNGRDKGVGDKAREEGIQLGNHHRGTHVTFMNLPTEHEV